MKILYTFTLLFFISLSSMSQVMKPYSNHYYQRVNEFAGQSVVTTENTIILGNSLVEKGGNWCKRLHRRNILNRGITGDGASGVYDRLYQILPGHPKTIFLIIGVNDISNNLSTDSIKILVAQIIDKIQTESPRTKLYLQSLLPINESFDKYKKLINKTDTIPELNDKLKQLARVKRICYINLFSSFVMPGTDILRKELSVDGLHLTEAGYTLWGKCLRKYRY
ncbi:MAG: GDSL-type esterase/lipase family protein [Bacteroidaceae bacterium]|nr:GDSL-type esterase/lipase family protein [Bacteroidaceae bacterium]